MVDDLKLIDDDPQVTINNILSMHEAITGRKLFPADPERLFILSLAQMIVQQKVLFNLQYKQNLLRYASGEVLDAWGESNDTSRLDAAPAKTTIRFRLSMPLTAAVIIPKGTRIGPQGGVGELFFSTTEAFEIKAGQEAGLVPAESSVPGVSGNGFLPGQLNVLIDPLPYVQTVANTTESAGGADRESDEAYRTRIRTAPESYSVAGPSGAYEYWAKSASAAIIDVGVETPRPLEVVVVPLLYGGEIPTKEILDLVLDTVNDRSIRPLTDKVSVRAPESVAYNIDMTYWIAGDQIAQSASILAAVESAVSDFRLWQKSKLGRNINPSELIRRVMLAGAARVEVTAPVHVELSRLKVAREGTVKIVFGGLMND